MEITSVVAAVVSAVATALLGLVAYRLSRQGQQYAAQRAIGDLQNAMATFRAEYPEIMRCAATWTPSRFPVAYGRVDDPTAAVTVRYTAYVDIGMEFCNTALAAVASRAISATVFEKHYRPLVRHFLAENYPFIASAMGSPFLPSYVRDELRAAESEGWDWAERHAALG